VQHVISFSDLTVSQNLLRIKSCEEEDEAAGSSLAQLTWPSSTHATKGTVAPSGFAEAKIAEQLLVVSHQQQHSDFKAAILASHVKRVEVAFKPQQIICPAAARRLQSGHSGKPNKAGRSGL